MAGPLTAAIVGLIELVEPAHHPHGRFGVYALILRALMGKRLEILQIHA